METGTPTPKAKLPKPPIPWWAWLFAGACFLIPIITMGGAIPGAIGGGGGFACIAASRGPTKYSTGARVGICAAITVGCWVLFIAFAIAVGLFLARPTPAP